MKVTTKTPELLIVDSRPWFWSLLSVLLILGLIGVGFLAVGDGEPLVGLVFGIVGLIAGGATFWVVTERSQVVFDRTRDAVEIRRKRVGQSSRITFPLSAVEDARVIGSLEVDMHRNNKSRKLVIVAGASAGENKGSHAVDRLPSNVGNHWGVADQINAWLERP